MHEHFGTPSSGFNDKYLFVAVTVRFPSAICDNMVEFIEVYSRSLGFFAGAGDVSSGSAMGIFGGCGADGTRSTGSCRMGRDEAIMM